MAQLRRRLPPANSLVIFEAAGRLLNFTHAGAELALTQSAVSRQVQLLEEHLGAPLFQRQGRRLELTRDGMRLHRAVSMGLEHIAGIAVDIRQHRGDGELTVATSVTFASYWLMARLSKFRAAHPAVELRLVASTRIPDLTAAGVDLAIRYGAGHWPGLTATRMFDNEIWPSARPATWPIASRWPASPTCSTRRCCISASSTVTGSPGRPSWPRRVSPPARSRRGLEFDNYLVLLQAAIRGEGIALCGGRLAEDFIARGDLVRPIEATLRSERAFYLLYPDLAPLSEAATLFREWLVAEAG